MKVVVVHDYLTQRGGAERVVLELLKCFPGARVVTSVYEPTRTFPEFTDYDIEPLWLNRFRPFRTDPRRAFPFLARAFERHEVTDADLVIASSSGWAHRVKSAAPTIVYCHNPARWLYQTDEYLSHLSPTVREWFKHGARELIRSDREAARRASAYLVNSRTVQTRVRETYGIDSEVAMPARGLSPVGPRRPIPGIEPGYILTVGRSRDYKNIDLACEVVDLLPEERLVVVGRASHDFHEHGRIHVKTDVPDDQLRWLYANASALLALSHEDFGLTPVEAQAFGVPSVVLRRGGYLDSTKEGLTGVFAESTKIDHVVDAVRSLRSREWVAEQIVEHGEHFAPESFHARIRSAVDRVMNQQLPPQHRL